MPDLSFYQWANALKGYALAFGVAFAIAMIVVWWRRSRADIRLERRVRAQAVFATSIITERAFQLYSTKNPGGRLPTDEPQIARYALSVCNQILLLDDSPTWHRTLRELLERHRVAITALRDREELPSLHPDLDKLVRHTIG